MLLWTISTFIPKEVRRIRTVRKSQLRNHKSEARLERERGLKLEHSCILLETLHVQREENLRNMRTMLAKYKKTRGAKLG